MQLHDWTNAQNTRLYTAQRHLRRFLRRTAPVVLGAGLVAVVGLSLSGTLTASNDDDHRGCTLATLKGRYLFASQGTLLPQQSHSRRQARMPDFISSMEMAPRPKS